MAERPLTPRPDNMDEAARRAALRRQHQREEIRRRNGRRNARGRKRSRRVFWLVLLLVLAGVIACVAMTLLCKAKELSVAGTTRYEPAVVLQAAGVREGDSLLLLNADRASEQAAAALPYVDHVILHRSLPSKVVVEVVESVPAWAYVTPDGVALCDEKDKLLEQLTALPEGVQLVLGADLEPGRPGQTVAWRDPAAQARLQEIREAVAQAGITGITRIDLRDEVNVTLCYNDVVRLDLGSLSSLSYKMHFVREYVDRYYTQGSTGVLNLTLVSSEDRKIYFREQSLADYLADTGYTAPASDTLPDGSADPSIDSSADSDG